MDSIVSEEKGKLTAEGMKAYKAAANNRSNQMNPNNDAYWKSRNMERPRSE